MSHELSQVSGRFEMFAAGEVPWHGLGINVKDRQTAAEAIKLAGLDWTVEQVRAAMDAGQGWTEIPDRVANIRRDPQGSPVYLGVVGKTYKPIQNSEAFSFFDSVVGEGKAIYESAGAIRDGRRVWILAKLNDDMVLKAPGGEDRSKQYLLFVNGHDGTMAGRMFFSPVRVICSNTLTSALRQGELADGVTILHKGDIKNKVAEAVRVLKIANEHYADISAMFQHFIDYPMTEERAKGYFGAVLPENAALGERAAANQQESRDKMLDLWLHGAGHDLAGETLWNAYNAVTGFADHFSCRRTPKRESSRFESLVWGPMAWLKQRAFSLAQDVVGVK